MCSGVGVFRCRCVGPPPSEVLGGLEGGREDTRGGTWLEVGEHIPLWFLAFGKILKLNRTKPYRIMAKIQLCSAHS